MQQHFRLLGWIHIERSFRGFEIMSISPHQEKAIEEFGTYEYDKKSIEKGKEVPIKEKDHAMDAIRYAVMGAWDRIKYWLPIEEAEEVQKIEHI